MTADRAFVQWPRAARAVLRHSTIRLLRAPARGSVFMSCNPGNK